MSTTIDQRVVEMKFDNSHFEKNVSTTMSTLDRLKQRLNFTGSTRGLEEIDTASKKINMSGLASSIETVQSKFSAMQVIGVTALANITNSAINAGKRIVSALTIDPVKTGFSEYETQINAIQTIMANTSSKGTTLEDVNSALDTLNEYADKTIYNFTEMTRNIGTFTAAGVDLDTSVSAIQGIANLAAVSGSTSQQASTAMYQLSQALASGTVKLQDWNSVVNAGMGGQVFQDALKRTAKNMGTDVDALIDKYGSFRESLSRGEWLTTDVLTETLKQFTMAAEEGSVQWEEYKKSLKEKGYTEEQATEILKMANTATDAATKVKTFTQLWDTLKETAQSGWTQTWEIIVGDFEEAKGLLTQVSEVIGDMINKTSESRNAMLQSWKDLGGRTALIDAVKNSFEGVMSIIKPVTEAFREVFPPLTGEQLYSFTEGLKKLTENFKISETTATKLKTIFKGLFSVIKTIADGFFAIIGALKPLAGCLVGVLNGTVDVMASFTDYASGLGKSIKNSKTLSEALDVLGGVFEKLVQRFKPISSLVEFVKSMFSGLGKIVTKVTPAFTNLGTTVSKAFGTDAFSFNSNGLLDLINSGMLTALAIGIKNLVDSLSEFKGPGGGILSGITDILDGVKDTLSSYQNDLKAGTLLKIAIAIAVLAASLVTLALIDPARLTSALAGMATLFGELFGAMFIFNKLADNKSFKKMGKIVMPMIGLSVAVLILASAMKKMAELDWNQLVKGLVGIAGAAGVLVASISQLSKNSGKMSASAFSLMGLATAIYILAGAVKKLGELDIQTLAKGLGGVGILLAELAIFMKVSNTSKMGVLTATGLLILSSALVVLANAVKQFGSLDTNVLIQGLAGVGAVLVELAIFTKLLGNPAKLLSNAIGLTILAAAMKIFGSAVKDFGTMSLQQMGQGLIGMAAALAILAVAMHAMRGALSGAAAMLVMAGALAIFTPQLMILSHMSLGEIGTGLLALAGAFAVIGIAGLILGPLVPTILGLAGAIALLGVGVFAIGAGLTLFSVGLTALAASGTAAATVIVTNIKVAIGLIPMILTEIGNGIIALAEVIIQGAPVIGAAITSVILATVQTLVMSIPAVVEGLLQVLTQVVSILLKYMPTLIDMGAKLIISLLQGIASNMEDITTAAIEIMINFINGVVSKMGDIIQAGIDLMVSFINGLADGVRNNTQAIMDAINNLFDALIEAALFILSSSIDSMMDAGGDIITWLIEGISGLLSDVGEAIGEVATTIIDTIGGFIEDFIGAGGDIINGLVEGITGGVGAVVDSVTGVAENALNAAKNFLGIHSPSKEFFELGKYSDQGLANGLKKYAHLAGTAAKNVGKETLNSLSDTMTSMSFDYLDAQPTIRPVLDLSDVESGASAIDGLFGMSPAVGALSNARIINSLMSNQNGGNNEIVSAINKLRNDLGNVGNTSYNINGITYDDGSNISEAVKTIVRAARVERRV